MFRAIMFTFCMCIYTCSAWAATEVSPVEVEWEEAAHEAAEAQKEMDERQRIRTDMEQESKAKYDQEKQSDKKHGDAKDDVNEDDFKAEFDDGDAALEKEADSFDDAEDHQKHQQESVYQDPELSGDFQPTTE